jgi:hypothetical protein
MNCSVCGRELLGRLICDCTAGAKTPMVCPKCGAKIPEGKIACDCFRAAFDNEVEAKALGRFASHDVPLYLMRAATGGHHILPIDGNCLSLCRKKRHQHPETRKLYSEEARKKGLAVTNGAKPDWCWDCLSKALKALANPDRAETPVQHETEDTSA